MLFVFAGFTHPELFRTGWFIESLITQTLIIHVIRTNKIPFFQSRASLLLTVSTFLIVALGIYLTISPLANTFGFVALPTKYWFILAGLMGGYLLSAQWLKLWFIKKYGSSQA